MRAHSTSLDLIDTRAAGAILGVSRGEVCRLVRRGDFRAYRPGPATLRLDRAEVIRAAIEREQRSIIVRRRRIKAIRRLRRSSGTPRYGGQSGR